MFESAVREEGREIEMRERYCVLEKKEREWTFCKAIEKAKEFREAIKLASSLKTTERESRETMLKKKINLGLVKTQKNVTSGEEV